MFIERYIEGIAVTMLALIKMMSVLYRTINDCYGNDDHQAMTWRTTPVTASPRSSGNSGVLGAKRKAASGHNEAMRNLRAAVVAECQQVQVLLESYTLIPCQPT